MNQLVDSLSCMDTPMATALAQGRGLVVHKRGVKNEGGSVAPTQEPRSLSCSEI